MRPIYDIEAIERGLRESDRIASAEALARAPTPLARRLVEAQRELAEATIIQLRVMLQLLNEDIDPENVARVLGVAMGNVAWALILRSSDHRAIIDTLMAGLIDPGSLGRHVRANAPATFVMGGTA